MLRTEVYLRSDIVNVLRALAMAAASAPDRQWRAGYAAALAAMAAAFGVEIAEPGWTVQPPARRAVNGGRAVMLVDRER